MPKVLNRHRDAVPQSAVYIGRGSKWGNPFKIGVHGTREEVIDKYVNYLHDNMHLVEEAQKELRGKDLVCYCSPCPCHGDVLLRIANAG